MNLKTCKKCNCTKNKDEFYKNRSRKDGVSTYCKECMSVMNRNGYYAHWHARRKGIDTYHYNRIYKLREKIDKFKIKIGCMKCGFNLNACCLDFHHLDPSSKKHTISNMINRKYSDEKLWSEISKCIILCANCHRMVHNGIISCENMIPCHSI